MVTDENRDGMMLLRGAHPEASQEVAKPGSFRDGSDEIIGACIEVHRHLGPGLLESAYETCLCHELALRGFRFERQRALPLEYKGVLLDCGYRLDLVVEERILVELKTVERLLPIHAAQVITYLKLARLDTALLVNFNVSAIKLGLRRLTRRGPDLPAPPDNCAAWRAASAECLQEGQEAGKGPGRI